MDSKITLEKIVTNRYFLKFKKNNILWSIIRFMFIASAGYYILYPLFIKLMLALMSEQDLYNGTVSLIPKHFTIDNMTLVFNMLKYPSNLANSFILSSLVVLLQIISGSLVGYGFARFKFPLKNLIFGAGMLLIIVPPQTLIITYFLNFKYFDFFGILTLLNIPPVNLINTNWPFYISTIFSSGIKGMLFVYMFRQFFRGMPKEIEEAALVDGAGALKTFYRIMLPTATPVITTVSILSFVWQWNDIMFSGWYFSQNKLLSISLFTLQSSAQQFFSLSKAEGFLPPTYVAMLNATGALFVIVPVLIIFIFLQKFFIQSVERSGIVG
jgi:multiple sugar transport system permease protein